MGIRCDAAVLAELSQDLIAARDDAVVLGLWPRQDDALHELQGGEQKTHVFYVSVNQEPALEATSWCRQPSTALTESSWSCSTGVVGIPVPRPAIGGPTTSSSWRPQSTVSAASTPEREVADKERVAELRRAVRDSTKGFCTPVLEPLRLALQ